MRTGLFFAALWLFASWGCTNPTTTSDEPMYPNGTTDANPPEHAGGASGSREQKVNSNGGHGDSTLEANAQSAAGTSQSLDEEPPAVGAPASEPVHESSASTVSILIGNRPAFIHVPTSYNPSNPTPLVIGFHGYKCNPGNLDYLHIDQTLANQRGFIYAVPRGTTDKLGRCFWNATDFCCDLFHSHIDDETYVVHVIEEVQKRYSIDPKRIYTIGHSNGGFMAYHMACSHADIFAAIVSVSGSMYYNTSICKPSEPVSVLHMHGTSDEVIHYNGGSSLGLPIPIVSHPYPSATRTVMDWAMFDGCSLTTVPSATTAVVAGKPITGVSYTNCKPGGHAELWTIHGGTHSPPLSNEFAKTVLDFFYAHPKPL